MWKHWVNVVLGLLIAVLPWLGLDAVTHQWTMVVAGLVVAVVSASFVWGKSGSGMGGM